MGFIRFGFYIGYRNFTLWKKGVKFHEIKMKLQYETSESFNYGTSGNPVVQWLSPSKMSLAPKSQLTFT